VIAQEQGGFSILATRPKSAGSNKHDTKKERKKEDEIDGEKSSLVH
jgi:hypothetical protein